MGFVKLLGRILIITALASSAYYHLQHPTTSVEEFKANYQIVDQLSNQYLSFDIPYDNVFIHSTRPTGSWEYEFSDSSKHLSASLSSLVTLSEVSSTWCRLPLRFSSFFGRVSWLSLCWNGTWVSSKKYFSLWFSCRTSWPCWELV